MKVGPRYKICKRLGSSVFEKCQTQKYTLAEARRSTQRSGRRRGMLSDYGKQLLEKQRLRYTYGISEKQLQRYVKEAQKSAGDNPAAKLHAILESRLDNIVYRLGLAPTRRAARQIVSHGHILVGDKKAAIPSYHVKVGDAVSIRDKSKDSPFFEVRKDAMKDVAVPAWLTQNAKDFSGKVKALPQPVRGEDAVNYSVVLEYYSR